MLRSNRKSTTRRRIALFAGILLPLCGLAGTPRLGTDPLHRVMKALSLEEKAALLVGASMEDYSGEGSVAGRTLRHIAGSAGTTVPLPQYGIPPTVMADGPAGLRIDPHRANDPATYYCTAFPVGTMIASTWNTELIEQVGAAIGNEVLAYGCDVILGPGIPLQPAHRGIRVQPHDQPCAQGRRLRQVLDMPPVENIKTPVREHDFFIPETPHAQKA